MVKDFKFLFASDQWPASDPVLISDGHRPPLHLNYCTDSAGICAGVGVAASIQVCGLSVSKPISR
jgi:hypothetical protein